jgi:hypothetical protein
MNKLAQTATLQERPMLNRSSVFALAAIATVAAAALAPTGASARGFAGGGFGGGHSFGGGGFARTASFGGGRSFGGGVAHTTSFAHISRGPVGGGIRRTFGNRNWGRGNPPSRIARVSGCTSFRDCGPGTPPGGNPNCYVDCGNPGVPPCVKVGGCGPNLPPPIVWWWKHHHHPHWGVVDYGTVDGALDTPVDTTVNTAVAPAPCNCLTKQYLDDGSVLFQDICTKEAALATPDELKAQAQGATPETQTQTP